jgi:hypothetical protein
MLIRWNSQKSTEQLMETHFSHVSNEMNGILSMKRIMAYLAILVIDENEGEYP